ncbi:hypothetical protein L6164_008776 [Bauhinia variegata]|uniref:Uncharacterized protein n=1 Tax=Bauhinia variegata TaxID=167791 RepID=A0ACB9PHK3_BAUVA|nr:hypothetical protein L6164_008776 [Bauhinia variegata]
MLVHLIVWLRFPELNMVYHNEAVLMAIGSMIGNPIRVDRNTMEASRGHFACICVEINLNWPLVGKFSLDDKWHRIEYEGLHLICTHCGCYGHKKDSCASRVLSDEGTA